MSEIQRIQDQLRRAFEGEAWHGPSLMELLEGVDAARAAARPLPRAHSIWEIVLHIAACEDEARRRMEGEAVDLSSEEQAWPPVHDSSEAAWREAIAVLTRGQEALRRSIAKLGDSDLGARAAGKDYDIYVLLHGVIQHDLYHAGQIAVLKHG